MINIILDSGYPVAKIQNCNCKHSCSIRCLLLLYQLLLQLHSNLDLVAILVNHKLATKSREILNRGFSKAKFRLSETFSFIKLSKCDICDKIFRIPYSRDYYPLLNSTRSRIVPAPREGQASIVPALELYPHLPNFSHFTSKKVAIFIKLALFEG